MMNWHELTIETVHEACDAVSELLTAAGAYGTVIEDPQDAIEMVNKSDSLDYFSPDFIKNLPEDVKVKAYFPDGTNINELCHTIKEKLIFVASCLSIPIPVMSTGLISEQDWANEWKKYYKAFSICKGIVIKPTWEEYTPSEGESIVEMDPGMAFGTGTHETTSMCAVMISESMSELMCKTEKNKVLAADIGCGSGILSAILLKLGADYVYAVDIDPVAVRVTKENLLKNNPDKRYTVIHDNIDCLRHSPGAFDIITANIIAAAIIEIAPSVGKLLKPGGLAVLSGIIKEKLSDVKGVYEGLGFKILKISEEGEWTAVLAKCPSSL